MAEDQERKACLEDEGRRNIHVHDYSIITDVADSHQHMILGVSAPARLANGSHVHRVRGRTSFFEDHWHAYDVVSDLPTEMPDGQHTHFFAGETTRDDGHVHTFSGVTGLSPDIIDDDCDDHVNNTMKYKYPKRDDE